MVEGGLEGKKKGGILDSNNMNKCKEVRKPTTYALYFKKKLNCMKREDKIGKTARPSVIHFYNILQLEFSFALGKLVVFPSADCAPFLFCNTGPGVKCPPTSTPLADPCHCLKPLY